YLSPNYSERKENAHPSLLVMHYTACPLDETLAIFSSKAKAVSSHYVIPTDGKTIYKVVDESKRAWHAGKSSWKGFEDINSISIGIENVNWGYTYGWVPAEPSHPITRYFWSTMIHLERRIGEYLDVKKIFTVPKKWHHFPSQQVDRLTSVAKAIMDRLNIAPENVVGHSDIAPQRKMDPGPLFPWERLAEQGVGVWPSPSVDRIHSNKPKDVSVSWVQESLQKWGYAVPRNGKLDIETNRVIQAFQMHFRPESYDQPLDSECCDILDSLLCYRDNTRDP
ncbi:MAG: amiD, partial [Chlamydiia bacterium]|nr:amiD [Chlamydiia bacterium]